VHPRNARRNREARRPADDLERSPRTAPHETAVEAFATAVEQGPADGVASNPGAWLTIAAIRKAIDRIQNKRDDKQKEA
jgi:predicted RNA polymerase sigma factor